MYFNLKTLSFQKDIPNLNETDYLKIVNCEHQNNKEVIALLCSEMNLDEPLHLHNGEFLEYEDEDIAVDRVKKQDKTFVEYLDFFTSKNYRIKNPIINDIINDLI